ncbi:TPA: hypothetical protein ACPSKQ_003279, partial [Legionella feeleii]
ATLAFATRGGHCLRTIIGLCGLFIVLKMKRKLESGTDPRLFKRQKSVEDLSKELIHAASLYQGKLQHISSNGYYVSQAFLASYANDFIINFCDSIGDVPPQIKSAVAEKFEVVKKSPPNTTVVERHASNENPHLCCWEFCLLVLNDINMISKEQIDDLCYIVYTINEQNQEQNEEDSNQLLTLADALFNPDGSYKCYSPDHLPSPGDLLIFRKVEPVLLADSTEDNPRYYSCLATDTREQIGSESRPYHCSIATDNQGNHIGLDSEEEYVKKKSFITLSSLKQDAFYEDTEYSFADDGMFLPDKVYYVPLEGALQNIANFIAKHQHILAQRDPALKKSEGEILEALIKNETQYDKLAQELLNVPKP